MRPAANATAASNASVAASTIGEIVGTPTNSLMGSPPSAATSPNESIRPSIAPIVTIIRASAKNWRMMSARVAPTARRTPISRVRSRTTMYMMFATPIPPDEQGEAPDDREKDVEGDEHLAELRLPLARVPEPQGVFVGRIEPVLPPHRLVHPTLRHFGQLRGPRPVHDVVQELVAEQGVVRRRRNEDPVLVALLIRRVLQLGTHHVHDRERRVAQVHLLPHGGFLVEQQLGQLVPQHRHAPPLGDIALVDETAARLGDDVAHQPVIGNDAGDGGRGGLDAAPDARAPRDELWADVLDLLDFAGD